MTLILTFIAITVCVTCAIAETNTVTIEDVTLQPGATREVPIRLLGSTGVGGVAMTLTFSPSIVNVTSVVAGDFNGMFTPDDSGLNNGVLKVMSMKSGQDLTGDLIIATITLGAVGAGGSCELGLHADLTDQSGHAVTSSVDGGTLTVGSDVATTDDVANEITFEGGGNLAVSTPTAAPTSTSTSPLTSTPSPTVTSSATTTTTAANTAAPAAATNGAATTPTTAPVAGGDETMPDAPAKNGLPGFGGTITIVGLLAIGYVAMRRKR
ncbi:MAG: cohesin domain-containing protein [Euryarchaeota archaeon]|nr:cohesin domain-containing protein [Euryarchaeota archaeon]